jgi:hypothetical protein
MSARKLLAIEAIGSFVRLVHSFRHAIAFGVLNWGVIVVGILFHQTRTECCAAALPRICATREKVHVFNVYVETRAWLNRVDGRPLYQL